jgi:hypothetical protein
VSTARPGIPRSILRPSAPTRRRSTAPWSALTLTIILAAFVSACGSSSPAATSSTGASSSAAPSTTASPSASGEPTGSSALGTTEPASPGIPTAEPSPIESAGPGASGSFSAGATDACYGSQDTKGFFSSFAQAVPWPVYCVVLPAGWSVETGSYRLRDGGRLTIGYQRRADGARIVLDEGALCLDTTGCAPTATVTGTIAFADREAESVTASDSSLAAVVDRGQNPSWLLTGTGLPAAEFQAIAAALHLIDQ